MAARKPSASAGPFARPGADPCNAWIAFLYGSSPTRMRTVVNISCAFGIRMAFNKDDLPQPDSPSSTRNGLSLSNSQHFSPSARRPGRCSPER